jgi:hypothetical protein
MGGWQLFPATFFRKNDTRICTSPLPFLDSLEDRHRIYLRAIP